MKNLIDITNEIIRKHEAQKDISPPMAHIYCINSLDEMKDLPENSIAICNGKVYMNIAMQIPTEILTVTGDLEW